MTEADDNPSAPGRLSGSQRFARDVFINVLANLVAAAIIYLAGALAGLLPRSGSLIFLSVFVVIGGLGFATGVVAMVTRGRWKGDLFSLAVMLLSVFAAAGPFLPGARTSLWDKVGYLIIGLTGFSTAIYFLRLSRKLRN